MPEPNCHVGGCAFLQPNASLGSSHHILSMTGLDYRLERVQVAEGVHKFPILPRIHNFRNVVCV